MVQFSQKIAQYPYPPKFRSPPFPHWKITSNWKKPFLVAQIRQKQVRWATHPPKALQRNLMHRNPKTDYNFREWCEKMNKLQNGTTGDEDIETLRNRLKQMDMLMIEAKNNINPRQYDRCCTDIIAWCNFIDFNLDFDKICLVGDFKRKYAKKTQW